MLLSEYQQKASKTAKYPKPYRVVYPILGAVDEACEACEKLMNRLWPDGNVPKEHYPLYTVLLTTTNIGKMLGKVKKQIRDRGGLLTPEGEEKLADLVIKNILQVPEAVQELASECPQDALWYCGATATDLGLNLDEEADKNLEKLYDRLARGVIQGEGDKR